MQKWFHIEQATDIPTPALLIYSDRVEENLKRMVNIAGGPDMLRPHVKTHKMSAVVKLNMNLGITKFKCATIAEAEMVAQCGGKDILLAMQPVGIQINRFFNLQDRYKNTVFSTITDSESVVRQIATLANHNKQETGIWLDINNGMNRSGIAPGSEAADLYNLICNLPYIVPRGLHVYDGHIHSGDHNDRKKICDHDFERIISLIAKITNSGLKVPVIDAGGTPTFPFHVVRKNVETSPGTCVLWDSGYAEHFPDLDFLPAAAVLTSVVSKPAKNLLCLDLGHKAIAAEMPHPRVQLLDLPVNRFVNHSEEHLVIETMDADGYQPGDLVYGIPWHICPTVPRYRSAYVIQNRKITGEWMVDARDRMITI